MATESYAKPSGYVDWVFGAGMLMRKRIVEQLNEKGIEFLLSDRIGTKQTSGGDGEICQLTKFLGYQVYYSSDLILDHAISPSRLTRWSFIKANFMNVYPVVYFYVLESIIKERKRQAYELYADFIYKVVKDFFYYSPRTLFGKYKFYSFIMLFQNIQLIGWLLSRKNKFNDLYKMVKANLYK